MPTIDTPEFDYYRYMQENPPDPSQIQEGLTARRCRRETAMEGVPVGIDYEVMMQFKHLFPDAQEYQSLINRALREWLAAQGVTALVREALQEMTAQAVAAISNTRVSPPNTA